MPKGTLLVKPQSAKLLKDSDFISKMDPFVLVKVGDQSKKSLVAKKGGLNPTWSDVLTFYINEEKDINFMIYDHDSLTKDDYLGEGKLEIESILEKKNGNNQLEIINQGVDAGDLIIEFEFIPNRLKCPYPSQYKYKNERRNQ